MPTPTLETALLNRFPETDRNLPPIPPLTTDENDALETFQFGLQKVLETLTQTSSTSSTPSTSTLALEDDEIRSIFASDKYDTENLSENDLRTPRASVNVTNRGNPEPMPSGLKNNRRLSTDELNPNAQPFVPTFLPHSVPQPDLEPIHSSYYRQLLRPLPDETLPILIPRWLRTFTRAFEATTDVTPDYDVLSMVVVNTAPWDSSEEMTQLAQEFAWYGTEEMMLEQNGAAAAFAQKLYTKFRTMRGEEYGETFLWHLKEAVLGTYMAVWDANNNPEAISYHWIPSIEYKRAAIALGAFIGDLFMRDIISPANVTACLNVLLQNLVSFEHVEAVQALVVHAGPEYWFLNGEGPEGIRRFDGLLVSLADRLHDEMSVVRRTMRPGEIKKAVGGIVMRCDMWMEQLVEAIKENELQAPDSASMTWPESCALDTR